MRKAIIGTVLLAAVLIAAMLWRHIKQQPAPVFEMARAKANHIAVWNSTAQVREPVAYLSFGERVDVLQRDATDTEVRTPSGVSGWVENSQLISQDLWQHATELSMRAGQMPMQASGRTRVPANLHLDAGRNEPMLVELSRDVPVQMLQRRTVTLEMSTTAKPGPSASASAKKHGAGGKPAKTSSDYEEWWLVHAEVKDIGPVAGWTLGRFIALNAPDPLPDYSTAANMRLVAWFILNRVSDDNGGEKPQYLAAGLRSGEGADYDFSLLRVYTWGNKQQRYETAYVEDNLRGKLPIRVTPATSIGGDSEFRFTNAGADGDTEFVYQMKQTSVRRIQGGPSKEKPGSKYASKSQAQRHAKLRAKPHTKGHPKTPSKTKSSA
jgi:hypothetical protein